MTRHTFLLLVYVLFASACLISLAGSKRAEAAPSVGWYVPARSDFRPVYEADRANQARQGWDGYWSWVQSFYGRWTDSGQEAVANVSNDAARSRLTLKLNFLGAEVAGEWAKDNSVRRIDTSDVTRWGAALERAKRADNGSGAALINMIDQIQYEVNRRLPERPVFHDSRPVRVEAPPRPVRVEAPPSPASDVPPAASGVRLTGTVQSVKKDGFVLQVQTVQEPDGRTTTLSPMRPKKVLMHLTAMMPVAKGSRVTVTGRDSGPGTPLRGLKVVRAPR